MIVWTQVLLGLVGLVAFTAAHSTDALHHFKSPPNQFRPKFRYWLTDGSADPAQVVKDVKAVKDIGAGGLEFLAYYNYGQYIRADVEAKLLPGNYTKDGFASPGFNDAFLHGLRAAVDGDLMFDIPLGGAMGQGVPAEYQSSGLLKELVRGTAQVESGEQYSGPLPSLDTTTASFDAYTRLFEATWGGPGLDLKAVVAAQLTGEQKDLGDGNIEYTLASDSLTDLTSHVDKHGSLKWMAPSGGNGNPWKIFAFFERYTDARSVLVPEGSTTWFGNGSWVVDHFSKTGAKKTTDFFDEYVFNTGEIKELLAKAKGLTWEDSMEFPAIMYWTPNFLQKFKASRGYDLTKYLPIMHCGETSWRTPYNSSYALDKASQWSTESLRDDFLLVLGKGYYDYLEHLNKWSASYGLQRSSQPAYNLPLNMPESAAHVAVPELESLAFGNNPMNYKQMMGAAHITGKKVISTEVGAVEEGAYALSAPRLKNLFQGSMAAGVNMMMIHGFPYGGSYEDATWPGFTTFHYHYTDMHGPRLPQWKHFDDTIVYTSRNQYILQTGTPKIDLAFAFHEDRWSGSRLFDESEYLKAGFSFEFLDPDNLLHDGVTVEDGILAPGKGDYRALILYNQTQISAKASEKLLTLAKQNLPIYLVGQVPKESIGTKGTTKVRNNMKELTKGGYPSVRVIEDVDMLTPEALIEDGVHPRLTITTSDDAAEHTYTFWRSDASNSVDYCFIVNYGSDNGPYSDFNFTFENKAGTTPYILDAWTGDESEVAMYNRTDDGHLTMHMTLKSQVSRIIAFERGRSHNRPVSSVSSNVKGVTYDSHRRLFALVEDGRRANVVMGNGHRRHIPAGQTPPSAFNVTDWNLSIDSYEPAAELGNDSDDSTTKTRKINVGKIDALKPWTEIDSLEQISGIGTYRAKFDWAPNTGYGEDSVVEISFGPVLNTVRSWINGKRVAPVDIADAKADISKLVHRGSNELVIEVSSTLFNAVKARQDDIHCLGESPKDFSLFQDSDWHEYGLIGPVEVRTFRKVLVP